jgi:hypothetical protein
MIHTEQPLLLVEIVRGRPVESAHIIMVHTDIFSINRALDALTFSSVPLKELSLVFWFSPELLPAIACRFPKLVESDFLFHFGEPAAATFEAFTPQLSEFKHLKSITFTSGWPIDNDHKIAAAWLRHCPTLKTIRLSHRIFGSGS